MEEHLISHQRFTSVPAVLCCVKVLHEDTVMLEFNGFHGSHQWQCVDYSSVKQGESCEKVPWYN